jgi:peptidoglycan/xylan/chitin deacetylase (PgdA/CDA1 family)
MSGRSGGCWVRAALWLFVAWPAVLHASANQVVLLRSAATAAHFKANGGDYDRLLNPWRGLFKRHGIKAREMRADELASLKQPAVLILASSVALADAERDAIRSRLAAGWSVLATWATGARDGKGGWQGYGFIEELFGAQVASDLPPPGKEDSFLLPFGETPLSHALPAGKRIYLTPTSEPLLRVRSRNAAARVANYVRDVRQPGALLGAVAFDERGGARRAYFGFAETSWTGAHLADIDALFVGSLNWLQRKPMAIKSAWPHPHQAALLLEMDTEDKFKNGLLFAQQLERFRIRGTFYLLTSEAIKHPDVVKRLASRHEIAYHGEVHDGFAKLDAQRQEARLRAMIGHLAKLMPDVSKAVGFRPPLEEYDANTERLLRGVGLRYLAGSPDSREDALPGFSKADAAIVVLPRTWLDDINFVKMALLEKDAAEKVLLASLDATLAMRGFGLLSVHTQNFYAGGAMERVMPRLLEAIGKHGGLIWAAPGEAIERWWRDREAVQVTARTEARSMRIQLKVTRGPVQRVRLVLFPPGPAQPPRLEAGQTNARLEKLDAHRWAIVLPELHKGDTELRVSF